MADVEKRPRGRPAHPENLRRRNNLTLRIRDETRACLEKVATANGRSMSEEAEMRLDQSFQSQSTVDQPLDLAFGPQLAGVLLLFGRVMQETGCIAGFATKYTLDDAASWLENSYAFDQASQAVSTILETLRPEGKPKPPKIGKSPSGVDLDATFQRLGAGFAATALRAVAGDGVSFELIQWAEQVRKRLGPDVLARIRQSSIPPEAALPDRLPPQKPQAPTGH